MKRKKAEKAPEKGKFRRKWLIPAAVVIATSIILLAFLLPRILTQSQPISFSFKAAIIDQLGNSLPNPTFNQTVTSILENAGFSVSYHSSSEVTVDFYRNLPKLNYGLVLLRTHAALRNETTFVDLFTSEPFSVYKHASEWNEGLVSKAWLPWESNYYFAIGPTFVDRMDGIFPKSIVIAMGCATLKSGYEETARAFVRKGAKAYIGWNEIVDIGHSDQSTISLLQYLLVDNKTINEAVSKCNEAPDPLRGAKLSYYPEIGNLHLSDIAKNMSLRSQKRDTALFVTNTQRFIKRVILSA